MGTGLIFIILGFAASVAMLFGLVFLLIKQSDKASDVDLMEQIKNNPLQKKALGRDLRTWMPLLLIGGLVSVSSATFFVFSDKSAMENIDKSFKALWEVVATPKVSVNQFDDILDPPPPPPDPPEPPPPPPTIDNVVIAEEKIDTIIEIDTSFKIEPVVVEAPVIKDDVIVDVPQKRACFDIGSNCEALSGTEQDECCQKAVLTYLAKVEYPTQAKDLGVEGKVLLRFVVEKDGSITQIEKIRGDDMLAQAAIRHIKNSGGKWTPGQQNGAPCRSRFVAPFTFKLR